MFYVDLDGVVSLFIYRYFIFFYEQQYKFLRVLFRFGEWQVVRKYSKIIGLKVYGIYDVRWLYKYDFLINKVSLYKRKIF